MSPSTDTPGDAQFAAEVLRKLLSRIATPQAGRAPFVVSHAWTEGPALRVVYTAPPSAQTWGLARDTRESIIDSGPWPDADEAAQYYFLVDFEENQPSSSPGGSDARGNIWWFGHSEQPLPQTLSEVPDSYRYTGAGLPEPPTVDPGPAPRRYADPPATS